MTFGRWRPAPRRIVAAEMGWQEAYARGVLRIWKARSAYCRACLSYPGRIALDGSPTGEVVADEARAMAREQLELRKRRREAERQASAPPEKPAEALPPPPPPPPQETPPKRAGFEALRQAHRNRIAAGGG